ncbi:MAG: hypothetical protein ABGY71_03175 [bacterium]
MNKTSAIGFALATLALPSFAQEDIFSQGGRSAGGRFGSSIAGGFDVDGDGLADFVVGEPYENRLGPMTGAVRVVSGANGADIYLRGGNSAYDLFGASVALGDLDGDGRAEFIVGAYGDDSNGTDSGTVFVYSGASGNLLYTLTGDEGDHFGFSISFVPDTNGDGRGDFVVGARAADTNGNNSGAALLFSGLDGTLLHEFGGEAAFDLFGSAVAGCVDLDGDGLGDLICGAYLNDAQGSGAGRAYVYSGASGSLLFTLQGTGVGDAFGYAVDDAGDVNGDGASDLIVGAPSNDTSFQNAGQASVYSGVDGTLLMVVNGDAPGDNFGSTVAGSLRIDGDGLDDFMVGTIASDANGVSSGMVRLFAGLDGSELATLLGSSPGARLGSALCSAGDMDLDDNTELLIGAWGEDGGAGAFSGVVHLVAFAAPSTLFNSYCNSNLNSLGVAATISAVGSNSLASGDLELVADGLLANQTGLFFHGSNQVQFPFGDGFLCVAGQLFRYGIVAADAVGQARLLVDYAAPPVAANQITAGSQWNFQFWYRDNHSSNAGFNLTDAMALTFAP